MRSTRYTSTLLAAVIAASAPFAAPSETPLAGDAIATASAAKKKPKCKQRKHESKKQFKKRCAKARPAKPQPAKPQPQPPAAQPQPQPQPEAPRAPEAQDPRPAPPAEEPKQPDPLPPACTTRDPEQELELDPNCPLREGDGPVVDEEELEEAEGVGGGTDQFLPWANGVRHRVIQANGGGYSHNRSTTRYGWDFALGYGEAVHTGIAGVVRQVVAGCHPTRSGGCGQGWGNSVQIQTADGTCARFAHLISPNVRTGQHVGRYHVVGTAGSSGNSTGTHLHYQREVCGSQVAVPSAFIEAGSAPAGSVPTSHNRPGPASPLRFDDVRVYSSNSVIVTAGGQVKVVVTARYAGGPGNIPCGLLNLGVRGDRPALFADHAAGFWPATPWRSPNRVAAVGCIGELKPGQRAEWALTFRAPKDVGAPTVLTGTWAPVWEGREWSDSQIPISLRIAPAEFLPQGEELVPADGSRVIPVRVRNHTNRTWERGRDNLHFVDPQGHDLQYRYCGSTPEWLNGNAVQFAEERVAPGQTATYGVKVCAAPGYRGTATIRLQYVREGVAHYDPIQPLALRFG